MKPIELTDIAAGYVSAPPDEEGTKKINISNAQLSLSPLHGGQFNELVGKCLEAKTLAKKPEVKRLSNKGGLLVKAKDLVAVLEAANKANVELDDPS